MGRGFYVYRGTFGSDGFLTQARFLFAQRHPCDWVLSCFMHGFKINGAMADFLYLEDTARLYDNCGCHQLRLSSPHQGQVCRWCLVHATHMTESETAALAASGVVAGERRKALPIPHPSPAAFLLPGETPRRSP